MFKLRLAVALVGFLLILVFYLSGPSDNHNEAIWVQLSY